MFAVWFLVLSLLAPSAVWSQNKPLEGCNYSKAFINHTANNITSDYQQRDVSLWVNNLERYMAHCQISPTTYGWSQSTFENWRDTGFKAEQKVLRARLERQAAVGKTSTQDNNLLRRLEGIMKVPPAETTAFINAQETTGQKNQSSCGPQDLRSDKLGPVHNQERLGWCYAFTGADLLSYKLGEKISAADIATVYSDGWKKELNTTFGAKESEYSGGFTKEAIEKMKTVGGVCREKDFASDPIEGTSLDTALNMFQQKKLDYDSRERTCGQDVIALTNFLPNVRPQEYIDLLKHSSRASFVGELRNKSCSPRVDISGIEVTQQSGGDLTKNRALFDSIDTQLDEKNVVEIAYWSEAFDTAEPERIKERSGSHSSLVVGRRFNEKTRSCEYLVRNSHGPKAQTVRALENDEGHFWISKEDLIAEIISINYLK